MSLTIILPNFNLSQYQDFPGQSLKALLQDAKVTQHNVPYQALLQSVFTLNSLPNGALLAFNQGLIAEKNTQNWCIASIYTFQADYHQIYMLGHANLNWDAVTHHEIKQLLEAHFDAYKMKFFPLNNYEWLITLNQQYDVEIASFQEMIGQGLSQKLPQGKDKQFWHQCITESQMLLNQYFQMKHQQSSPNVGLWFWGMGALPTNVRSQYDVILSDEPVIQALGKLSGVHLQNAPVKMHQELLQQWQNKKILMVDHSLLHASADNFTNVLKKIEETWLMPLKALLDKGKIKSFEILTNEARYTFKTSIWKRLFK